MQIAKVVDTTIIAETFSKIEKYLIKYIINIITNYHILFQV